MATLLKAYALVLKPKEGRERVLGIWQSGTWAYKRLSELNAYKKTKIKGTTIRLNSGDTVSVKNLVEKP